MAQLLAYHRGSEEGDSFDADSETNLSQQARNAHSSHWQPWQDRLLITPVHFLPLGMNRVADGTSSPAP
jgi:hypothetical protein